MIDSVGDGEEYINTKEKSRGIDQRSKSTGIVPVIRIQLDVQ